MGNDKVVDMDAGKLYQLVFYVPIEHGDAVKEAVFSAGAGRIGDYDHCCWQVAGMGQFRPLAGSDPFLGEKGEVNQIAELRVEMVCEADSIKAAVAALKQAHPYEEPAYSVWALLDL